ncbi:hypothetical protein F2Q68_00039914 [Brassica cretica]|uniref:Uncharacterized protein n=1 Tax=Brassica cretica TaxID=69181 RepID=A0A8S9MGR8_BRACR|nr:hypothetical protein F2Q68_00039914 [Brassica cretica]
MASNFFRYFLASWIRAREEGLEFGLEELRQLFAIKRNSGFPGTMILTPRPDRSIIDEPFGPAPMTPELRGLIATLRRGSPRWLAFTVDRIRAAYALPPDGNRATPIGPAAPIRPGKGHRNKRRGRRRRYSIVLTSPPKPVSIAVPVGGARRAPNTSAGSVGDQALDDDVDSSTHRRQRRALEEINSVSSNSPSSGLPRPLRASCECTSEVDQSAHLPDVHETSSWRFLYDNEVPILGNPESLALIWRKIREKGCELPSLGDMRERDTYVWMAVVNPKAMEASNEYATLMERRLADFPRKEEVEGNLLTIQKLQGELEAVRVTEKQRGVEVEGLKGKLSATETEKVANQNDLDSMKEKHRREIKSCDAAARKERNLARRSLAREYDAVLAVVKDKLQKKKEDSAAEIRLQEVRARIEAVTEYSEGGFELEEELGRLRDREISLDLDYGLASVSDPSLSRLELPEVSGDSVDQEWCES